MGHLPKPLPDSDYLHELLAYSLITGNLYWRKNGKRIYAGNKAGSFYSRIGYYVVVIDKQKYYAHRLIWKMITGADPAVVDHIDGNGSNNCWLNLREANVSQNGMNRKQGSSNSSGYKGVYYHKQNGCFTAQICVNYKKWHLGCFPTAQEASAAYQKASQELHGEFANN